MWPSSRHGLAGHGSGLDESNRIHGRSVRLHASSHKSIIAGSISSVNVDGSAAPADLPRSRPPALLLPRRRGAVAHAIRRFPAGRRARAPARDAAARPPAGRPAAHLTGRAAARTRQRDRRPPDPRGRSDRRGSRRRAPRAASRRLPERPGHDRSGRRLRLACRRRPTCKSASPKAPRTRSRAACATVRCISPSPFRTPMPHAKSTQAPAARTSSPNPWSPPCHPATTSAAATPSPFQTSRTNPGRLLLVTA